MVSKNPLVSVIIPVYNVEKYIAECIHSVLMQTYKNLEIIIVDDGSEDEGISICERMTADDKRCTILHEENAGLSAARNHGLKSSHGDYFMFVDSDDYMEVNAVESLVKTIQSTGTQMCVMGTTLLTKDGTKREVPPVSGAIDSEALVDEYIRLQYGMIHSAWGKLFDGSLKDAVYFPVGRLYEDQFVIYSLTLQHTCSVTNESTYIYRIREGSIITANSNIPKKTEDMMDSMKVVYFALRGREGLRESLRYKLINDSLQLIKFCAVVNLENDAFFFAKNIIDKTSLKYAKKCGLGRSHQLQFLAVKYCYPLFRFVFAKSRK